ncbi:MFS transporter permease [Microbacterium mangrovi]|uniref:MFS transporter permease n=1 Tax=Microbacterium mangrovi TaxID=1348253 RepID=A0A0B2A9I0_9MICO|nr:MFS transporter [Microbacterium mangrovi]KHK98251.1 MFS transporter permease [Microbacterium mangrovi]
MTGASPRTVGTRWFVLFTLAWLAIWTVQLTPVQLLLPTQLNTATSTTGTWVAGVVYSGVVLGVGGLAGVIAGPVSGMLSDRTRTRWGRRRPWAIGASVWTGLCLVVAGLVHGPWPIGLAWTGVSVGVAVASAAFTALIADQLPESQRGAASASASSSQAVGIVLGVGAVVLLGLSIFAGYLVLALFIAFVGTLAALLLPDPPVATGPTRDERRLPWVALGHRDFAWVVWGRFVTNVGNALPTTLFLFFLMYGLGEREAEAQDNLLLVIVVYTIFVVAASVLAGWWSDRTGRRRVLTMASAVVQAAAAVVIVVAPSLTTTMVAAAVLGAGYGAFSTVGLAFATDLLPFPDDHARDLGLVNVSAALGQLVGPLVGATLVALVGGFWLLLIVSAVLSVVGAGMSGVARERVRATP